MKTTNRGLASAFILSLVAMIPLGAGNAHATVVLDQSSTSGGLFGSAAIFHDNGFGNLTGQSVAQTFTVGISGVLDHIDVSDISLRGTGQSPLTLQLRDVSGGEPGGTILGTSNVNAGDIVSGTASFDLSGLGLSFNSGDLLAFSVVSDSVLANDYFVRVFAGAYGAGDSFLGANAGAPWNAGFSPGADLHFQTFVNDSVSVPEPGLPIILGVGLLGLCTVRRRNRAA